jgi:cytosine/adenosine deaminase-related metal-dependent hydrolase
MSVDIAISDALVLTIDEQNRLYERGTVLVDDGRISRVRKSEDGDGDLAATHKIDGDGMLVMPGLVNTHTHLEMTPLIGAFSDLDLMEMMGSMTAIYNRLGEGDFDYFLEAGYELAALNFLLGGVTTVNSMDVRPGPGAETFGKAGLRGFFGPTITDLFWDVPVNEQFNHTKAFILTFETRKSPINQFSVCRLWHLIYEIKNFYFAYIGLPLPE